MPFTLATWNINSVRLRAGLVEKLLTEEAPDVLCLQECKSPVEKIPHENFAALGYTHMVARGEKGYNGVAILSKLPIEEARRARLGKTLGPRACLCEFRPLSPARCHHVLRLRSCDEQISGACGKAGICSGAGPV